MLKMCIIIFILFLFSVNSKAQDKSLYFSFGNNYNVGKLVNLDQKSDSLDVKLFFKFANNSLIFEKLRGKKDVFKAEPEVEFSIKDENGITRFKTLWKKEVFFDNYERTKKKDEYIEDFISLKLANKKHDVNIDFLDNHNMQDSKFNFNILEAEKQSAIYDDLFIVSNDGKNYTPYILNSSAYFDPNGFYIYIPIYKLNEAENFNYKLERVRKTNETEGEKNIFNSIKMELNGEDKCELISGDLGFDIIDYKVIMVEKNDNYKKYLKIFISPEKIFPGAYKLTILNDENVIKEFGFDIIWNNMPLALRKISYAIKKMHFILTNEEYEKLEAGNEEEQVTKFIDYWRKMDPTPKTPYNEALNQYYSRVDYTYFNFQTMAQRDGSNTDRGKIYILYGPPSTIKNNFKAGKPQIIWEYSNINKKFIFETVSSGVIRLIEAE